jgi:16S rRNA (cytidine1402-2'-O)-methyltransferase
LDIIQSLMHKANKQVLPPGLWVVATPIGNLGDMTPRAREILEQADGILCEDTRETFKLLNALGIDKPRSSLVRLDAHATEKSIDWVVHRMLEGERLALVTDAGTPAISDPGSLLVQRARTAGVLITPVPGASALMALLSTCGFAETAFTFRGFFPRKASERMEELRMAAASSASRVFVWFESPHRIVESLESLVGFAPEAEVVAAKELTKLHEGIFGGTAREVAERVQEEVANKGAKGEWCFALRFSPEKTKEVEKKEFGETGEAGWILALRCLLDAQVPASEAVKRICQYFGVSRKSAYEKALVLSGKKDETKC